jgi:PTS system beta-glucosides-specific IIC component
MQVKEGDEVKKGQLLLIFDLDEIKQAGYDIVTPVIITNSEAWDGLQISDRTHILSGDAVMSLSR